MSRHTSLSRCQHHGNGKEGESEGAARCRLCSTPRNAEVKFWGVGKSIEGKREKKVEVRLGWWVMIGPCQVALARLSMCTLPELNAATNLQSHGSLSYIFDSCSHGPSSRQLQVPGGQARGKQFEHVCKVLDIRHRCAPSRVLLCAALVPSTM